MKYFTGTSRKKRSTRRSKSTDADEEIEKQHNSEESLQTSTEVEKKNPRKRGRPRASKPDKEENSAAKKSKSDSKNEARNSDKEYAQIHQSQEKTKPDEKGSKRPRGRPSSRARNATTEPIPSHSHSLSLQEEVKPKRSDDESGTEQEVAQNSASTSRHGRITRSSNSAKRNSIPTDKSHARPVKRAEVKAGNKTAKSSPEKHQAEVKMSKTKYKQSKRKPESENDSDAEVKRAKLRSKSELSTSNSEQKRSYRTQAIASQAKQTKSSNGKSVKYKVRKAAKLSAELSDSTIEADELYTRSKDPDSGNEKLSFAKTSKLPNRKSSSKITTSNAANSYAELSDSASEAEEVSTSSKASSLKVKRNKVANKESRSGKTQKAANSSAELSASTSEANEVSTSSKASSSKLKRNVSNIESKSHKARKAANVSAELSDSPSEANEISKSSKASSSKVKRNVSNKQSRSHKARKAANLSAELSDSPSVQVNELCTQSKASNSSKDDGLIFSDGGSDGWQSDREFLQQQVNMLMTSFDITDCSELATKGTKRRQKDHLSQDVISKSLRKLNYKVEDELLKTFNRQGQRKILQQIQEIRHYSQHLAKNTLTDDGTKEDNHELDTLKKMLETSQEELRSVQGLKERAIKLERMLEEMDAESLSKEIKQTNKLLKRVQDKIKKQEMTEFAEAVPNTIGKGPSSHQEIINKLFPK